MKRISRKDEIKATAMGDREMLASLFDSGFTTLAEVEKALIRKIPFYSGSKLNITITNLDKQESKNYDLKVNF